jgi:hypothetical protein
MIGDLQEKPFHNGIVYYLDRGRVHGVLCGMLGKEWMKPGPYGKKDLIGRITS